MPASPRFAVVLVASFVLTAAVPCGAAVLPPGFVETHPVTLAAPGGIDWSPDGAMWITQHTGLGQGRVWVFRDGALTLAATLATNESAERGLHSIAVDPDYATNQRVWLYYTTAAEPLLNRLSHFTNVDDLLVDEVVVLEGPPVVSNIHNGGCLAFASDKTLFLGMGDDLGASSTAQDPFDLRGKILHLNRDGSPAWDNPFLDGTAGEPRVWALGFRNPFRCSVQPHTDNLFIGDVGSFRYEEINIGFAGGNFGWAAVEGVHPPGVPGYVYATLYYPGDGGSAVIAGGHAPASFNPLYEGNFFYGDWARSEIHRVVLDASQSVVSSELWATGAARLTEVKFGPDGALYYTVRQGSTAQMGVFRVEYVGGDNRQPIAVATADPDNGTAPLVALLDGSGSFDPDDDALTYEWDLGDGGSASGPSVSHGYAAGVYEARLTVDDGNGLDATSIPLRIVSGNRRPTPTITAPADGSKYDASQTIGFAGTASDPEESISCAGYSWKVIFHHAEHTHPYLGPVQGSCSGSFVIANRGETSADVWYEVRQTVADTGAPLGSEAVLEGAQSIFIYPNLSTIGLETAPRPDLDLELDTVPVPAPAGVEGVVGVIRSIGAPTQAKDGHTWTWLSWSDGGDREHEIVTPAAPTTYTATFGCDVAESVSGLIAKLGAGSEIRLDWIDVADACHNPAAERYRIYAASSPIPAAGAGEFPLDPEYRLLGSSTQPTFAFDAADEDRYFLVVGVGTDLLDGNSGHYDDLP